MQSFTSTISHEFRTPLGTSLMFLDTLQKHNLPKMADGLVNLVISQLNLLLCLVNDVLDIRLIQEGKFQQKIEKFDP